MRLLHVILVTSFSLFLAGSLFAQEPAGPGKCPPYDEPGKTFDASPIVDAIDTNHDNIMTHEEWVAAEAPDPSWNAFMSKEKCKKQGYITRDDFVNDSPPNGIDTDCDGLITLDEFLATKKWKMPGPPPGGDAPPGGAPPRK